MCCSPATGHNAWAGASHIPHDSASHGSASHGRVETKYDASGRPPTGTGHATIGIYLEPSSISRRIMQTHFLTLLLLIHSALASASTEAIELTIGLIGDSTVATTYGWGPAFSERFGEHTQVINVAKNGATLESLSSTLDQLLNQQPDYVLIQFGHNDQKKYGPDLYRDKLTSYVERVKKAGAKAIILSSVTRRNFGENGRIEPRTSGLKASLAAYATAARDVAQQQQVLFIDLNAISVKHHNRIGPEASAAYNFEVTDTTHFSPEGAAATAELVIEALETIAPEITANVRSGEQMSLSLEGRQPDEE